MIHIFALIFGTMGLALLLWWGGERKGVLRATSFFGIFFGATGLLLTALGAATPAHVTTSSVLVGIACALGASVAARLRR